MNDYIKFLRMESTWRGLILILGALGVFVHPQNVQEIVGGVFAAIGARDVLKNENRRKSDVE